MQPYWYRTFPRLTFLARRIAGASYEREMELLEVLCDPARTGVDVGAKVGMYTYRIRAHSLDVIAFEPIPLFHHMLKAVFEGKRARIEAVAASSTRGKATLRMPYDHGGGPQFGRSTIDVGNPLTHAQVARTEQLEVDTRRLDDCALGAVGFIKVDVEGHELAVLEGAAETIAAHRPNLLIECNDDHQVGGIAKLAQWFAAHDYDATFLAGQAMLPITAYDRGRHWDQHYIENFIGIPRERRDVHDRVAARAAVAPVRGVAR